MITQTSCQDLMTDPFWAWARLPDVNGHLDIESRFEVCCQESTQFRKSSAAGTAYWNTQNFISGEISIQFFSLSAPPGSAA
jgi:hypothetical protein